MNLKYVIAGAGLALVLSINAYGQQDSLRSNPLNRDITLPKECWEAEEAQRMCTEHQAAFYERHGHPEAAKTLRDGFPGEMEKARRRWSSVPNKEVLALSCAAVRDGINAQPSCKQ